MKRMLQWLLKKPVTWLADKFASSPHKKDIFESLSIVLQCIRDKKESSGVIVPFDLQQGRFIIFSDQHKGAGDAADDFKPARNNYQAALEHYFKEGFTLVMLGDCEELWENEPTAVFNNNLPTLQQEAAYLQANRYYRVFGNHDLEWKYEFPRNRYLKPVTGDQLRVYEGIVLQTVYNKQTYDIFLTHGHQGDQRSDGNAFSMWFVAAIWTPIQRFLEISLNTISDSFELVDKHNIMLYEWSATQQNLLLVSGHTHKPVFASLDHIERLHVQLAKAQNRKDAAAIKTLEAELERRKTEYLGKQFHKTMVKPSYFNSGCCCFEDGDITGIEIENDTIRLIKWETDKNTVKRRVLEESPLSYLFDKLDQLPVA